MQSVKNANGFPYMSKLVCYIEVDSTGEVKHVTPMDAYKSAKAGKSKIYAVWPGQRRSDLFVIDDINGLGQAIVNSL